MTRLAGIPLALALSAALLGCKTRREVGHFGDRAFYHARDHYRIRYRPDGEETGSLLPPGWSIDNYAVGAEGRPTVASREPRFWTGYAVEHPRGGTRHIRAERIDLRFVRSGDPAMIWARTVPTSESWADAPLEQIVRGGVRGLASGARPGLDLFGRDPPLGGRTMVRVRDEGPAQVDGRPAYFSTFDLIRTPAGSVDRVTVVVARPGSHRWRYRRWSFPMLLIFGYVSSPATHEGYRRDFAGFVSRVDIAR
jgi:hypothetical protein